MLQWDSMVIENAGAEVSQPDEAFALLGLLLFVILCGGVIATPLFMLAIIGVQAVNPFSKPRWTKPSWQTNFLQLRDPLHGFHMLGYVAMFLGLGAGSATIIAPDGAIMWLGPVWMAQGLSVLCGVRLCMRVFSNKYGRPDVGQVGTVGSSATHLREVPRGQGNHDN